VTGGGGGEGRKLQVGGGSGEEAAAGAREKAREVSVRRLAAGVWRLRPPEAVAGAAAAGGAERRVRVGVEVRSRAVLPHLPLQSPLRFVSFCLAICLCWLGCYC
jgi:hypothetical protein